MNLRIAAVALAASAGLLTACAAAPDRLPDLTQDEAIAVQQQQNEVWWDSMFPGEPMPVVEVRGYLDPGMSSTQVTDCILDADLPGVQAVEGGLSWGDMNSTDTRIFNRVQWECSAAFPYATDNPQELGLFSDEQLSYLANYFRGELAPCLTMLGYDVGPVPTAGFVSDNGQYPKWVPYYSMQPQPTTAEEWQRIDFHCPPPRVGQFYRSGLEFGS